jgi:predicted permease
MQATVSVLLIVVAVNVAVLIYARTATRGGEIAVRTALGASRGRIVTQLFIEALVLSSAAAAVGLGITKFGLDQAHQILQMEFARPPYWLSTEIPAAAVVYVIGLALLAAIIAGLLPALHATGRHVESTLRQLGGGTGRRLGTTWTVLIVSQVAFAVAALPVAVALAWPEVQSTSTAPAFAVEQYLLGGLAMDPEPPADVDPAAYRAGLNARFAKVQADLLARLELESWVSDVTVASQPPGSEEEGTIEMEGLPAAAGQRQVRVNRIDIDFLQAFDAQLLTGRAFTSADIGSPVDAGRSVADSQPVIVSRALVQQMLGGSDAVGRRFRYSATGGANAIGERRWYEIVGVAADLHTNAIDPTRVEPILYHPLKPGGASRSILVLRVSGGTAGTYAARLRDLAATVDPTVRLSTIPMVERYRQANVAVRLIAVGLTLVIASVLLLSAAGIYALMSFTVSQRRREIGIRAALGADGRSLLRSIFARSAAQLAFGIAVGIVAAILIDVFSDGEILGAKSALLLPMMSALMLVVGLLASIGPARRGLSIQVSQALREE